jgi:hypothetical protein
MWHYNVTVRSNTWLQRPVTTGGNVNTWWWIPIGLAAWFLVAVVMALCIGAVLRRAAQARESLDRQVMETSGGDGPHTLKRTHSGKRPASADSPDVLSDQHLYPS